jgi:CrcB protein
VSAATLAVLGLAGGAGAVARFVVDGAVASRVVTEFPLGTLAVNLTGALALGVLVGAGVHGDAYRIAATGALGGYTTFSTWMYESQRLSEDGELRLAALNFAVSLVAGVVAVWVGRGL